MKSIRLSCRLDGFARIALAVLLLNSRLFGAEPPEFNVFIREMRARKNHDPQTIAVLERLRDCGNDNSSLVGRCLDLLRHAKDLDEHDADVSLLKSLIVSVGRDAVNPLLEELRLRPASMPQILSILDEIELGSSAERVAICLHSVATDRSVPISISSRACTSLCNLPMEYRGIASSALLVTFERILDGENDRAKQSKGLSVRDLPGLAAECRNNSGRIGQHATVLLPVLERYQEQTNDMLPSRTVDVLARDYRMSLLLLSQLKRGHWMILDQLPRMRIHPADTDSTLETLLRERLSVADASNSLLAIRIAACRLRMATNAPKQAEIRKVIEETLGRLQGDDLLAGQLEFDLCNLECDPGSVDFIRKLEVTVRARSLSHAENSRVAERLLSLPTLDKRHAEVCLALMNQDAASFEALCAGEITGVPAAEQLLKSHLQRHWRSREALLDLLPLDSCQKIIQKHVPIVLRDSLKDIHSGRLISLKVDTKRTELFRRLGPQVGEILRNSFGTPFEVSLGIGLSQTLGADDEEYLKEVSQSDVVRNRWCAAWALSRTPSDVTSLRQLLNDPSPIVLAETIRGLAAKRAIRKTELFRLSTDARVSIREASTDALNDCFEQLPD